jgi:TetR/AcrR family transcriptional regulator, tetracycline repressor protein
MGRPVQQVTDGMLACHLRPPVACEARAHARALHLPGLWHLPSKAALITAVADRILDQELTALAPPGPDERWQDWLAGLAQLLRRALLAHPDGARILSASQLSLTMAAISELAMSTLVTRGVPLQQARVIVLTVERFTVGHVLEEQAPRPDADALSGFDMAAFAHQHPTLMAATTEYFRPGRTVDDLFRDCLQLVIDGATAAPTAS